MKMDFSLSPAGNSPAFLIIGAQKCATTSLHFYLDQHPQLSGSTPKEVHFFDQWQFQGKDILQVKTCSIGSIDLSRQNARQKEQGLLPEDRLFLESYYENPNEQLFKLLGYQPNW